jgi:MPBQ/MSBQ methyltransferase
MLFPPAAEYERWFRTAGFDDVRTIALAPDWYRGNGHTPYALAVSGSKRDPGPSPAAHLKAPEEPPAGPLRFAARFVLGSAAGAVFVPIAAVLQLRARRGRRR